MKKEIIIYGYSNLATKIVKILEEKAYKILVVDFNDENIKKAKEDGYKTYKSLLLNDNELLEVGIKDRVDSLFCLSDSTKNNLFVTFSARNINKNLKIITISKTKAESKKLMTAGATKVLNSEEFVSLRIFRYLTRPRILRVIDEILFNKSDLKVEEIYIDKSSIINGVLLNDMKIHKEYNIILLGLLDKELSNNFIFNTKGINHKVDEGDVLVVLGKSSDLISFNKHIKGD